MPLHKDLTGADLHEPKGVSTASSGTVYVANGSGSGSWGNLSAVNSNVVDAGNHFTATTVEGVLLELFQSPELVGGVFPDVSTPSTVLVPIPFSCEVLGIEFVLGGTITGADSTVSISRSDGASMGIQTIAQTGSAEGTSFSFVPVGNAVLTYPTHKYVKLVSDGGSTGAQPLYFTISLRRV